MCDKTIDARVDGVQVFETGHGNHSHQSKGCATIDTKNLGDRHNEPIETCVKTDGAIARLPVTLAELKVRFFLQADINLPEPALEIRDIKKDLKVTQCTLLQPTNVLFVKGFVRKNIDYSTRDCSNSEGVCGDIRHCTMDVPFEFTTPIEYTERPDKPILNERREFEYLGKSCCEPGETINESDRMLSKDFSQFNQESFEYFNRQPFCDLIFSRIIEFDKYINRRRPNNIELPFEERTFVRIEEKMVLELGLRILQEQQVLIPSHHSPKIKE